MRFGVVISLLVATTAGAALGGARCVDGTVEGYPCAAVTLMSHLTEAELGVSAVTDNWGWEDPVTGVEYAILAATQGTLFVSLEDPDKAVLLGRLPSHGGLDTGIRDVKVYADHAFIVADVRGHGMQVLDLTQLRDVVAPPVTFAETAHYDEDITEAHNIAIDPVSGFAYLVAGDDCSGGLHMVDLSTPTAPVKAGCYAAADTIHDAVCQVYSGPDAEHLGRQICIAADLPGSVTIVDVTDKESPATLASVPYAGAQISHQGWTTPDQRYYRHGDEGDESLGANTTTYVWDIQDLDAPVVVGTHVAGTGATDHNGYVTGDHLYQANYRAGLRILEIEDPSQAELTEVAFLDTRPASDSSDFSGAWSTYPFFDSGLVVVTDTQEGLFVVRPELEVFSDGFESGDTLAWSVTVPVP